MSTRKRKEWRNTGPAVAATRARSAEGRERVQRAIHDLTEQGIRLSFAQISKASGVSRATLYADDDVRSAVESGRRSPDASVAANDARTKEAMLRAIWGGAIPLRASGQKVSTAVAVIEYCLANLPCTTARRIVTRYRGHLHALKKERPGPDCQVAAAGLTCLDLQNDREGIVDWTDEKLRVAVLVAEV